MCVCARVCIHVCVCVIMCMCMCMCVCVCVSAYGEGSGSIKGTIRPGWYNGVLVWLRGLKDSLRGIGRR